MLPLNLMPVEADEGPENGPENRMERLTPNI